jgi:hypothetical protein
MNGSLGLDYEEALNLTQGHSRSTAERFYIKRKMSAAAINATVAHRQLHGEVKSPDLPPMLHNLDEEYQPELEGLRVNHPTSITIFLIHSIDLHDHDSDGNIENKCPQTNKRQRTVWSVDEEKFIIKWIESHTHSPFYQKRINWQTLTNEIRERSRAGETLFPQEHMNPTLLMECAKRIK